MYETLKVQSHMGPYTVSFEDCALAKLNESDLNKEHFIIDTNVAKLYRKEMKKILSSSSVLLIEANEANKSLEKVPKYVGHLVKNTLRRDQKIIAIGGGIIQDIACFLASTMLRGVPWHFFPTTLLAQADSCIGSKSSINCGNAKNILGTFKPPDRVMVCMSFLDTLKEPDLRSGVGEIIKAHVIDGSASFNAIAADYRRLLDDRNMMCRYIYRSLEIKKSFIEKDEFDRNIRNVFNYGHSFGHAIEVATNFTIPHGIAVTIGMDMANYLSWKLGKSNESHYKRMNGVLKSNYSGFEKIKVPMKLFREAIAKDKKNVGSDFLTLILINQKGEVFKDRYANNQIFFSTCEAFLENERML